MAEAQKWDPPDTGQITETSTVICGALKVVNDNSIEYMDTILTSTTQNTPQGNKRPGDNINNIVNSKQANTQVSQTLLSLQETGRSQHDVTNPNTRLRNKYKITDNGPYFVIVENKLSNKLHPMYVGKILYNSNFQHKDKINIKDVGKCRVKIETNNSIIANSLVELNLLNNNELEAYIPDYNMHRQGVVRNIDTSLSDNEIINDTLSDAKIVGVRRLTRKINNNGISEIIKLQTCVLKFEGQNLPQYVYIFGTRCEVNPYVPPVVQCYNCLRYGHMSRQCKSDTRCTKCNEPHNVNECPQTTPKCLYCKGDHYSTYRKCPEYMKQNNIKKIMTLNNLTYLEAKKTLNVSYANITNNRPDITSHKDFPTISNYENPNTSLPSTSNHNPVRKHINFTQKIAPRPQINTPRNTFNHQHTQHQINLPVNPIGQNPYTPHYHNLQSNVIQELPFLKEKISLLIQKVIEDTQNNVAPTLNDVNQQLDKVLEVRSGHGC